MFKQIVMGVLAALVFCQAFAVGPEVAHLQREWAEIKYKQPRDAQEHLFAGLLEVAEEYAAKAPSDPEVLIWYGIVESSYASARGGLGALEHVKNAKKALEKVIETNPLALDGSALTSLGSLYYQVPGWPIGFGDDKKAIEYLKKGLAANPDGMDSNFFYGDFLFRSGDYAGAEQALKKALKAAPRPGRALADEGRKAEIDHLLQKIAEKK